MHARFLLATLVGIGLGANATAPPAVPAARGAVDRRQVPGFPGGGVAVPGFGGAGAASAAAALTGLTGNGAAKPAAPKAATAPKAAAPAKTAPAQKVNGQQQQAASVNNQQGDGGAQARLTLKAANVQKSVSGVGQKGATPSTSPSQTSDNNFLNFCDQKTKCDGTQKEGGCCSGIPQGEVPAFANMPTVTIVSPKMCSNLAVGQPLLVTVIHDKMQLGTFTNPDVTYIAAPQTLVENETGAKVIKGHTHVTCDRVSGNSFNPATPVNMAQSLAARKAAKEGGNGANTTCFKGFDGAGRKLESGLVAADVDLGCGTLAVGCWRCSTLTAGANHQNVVVGKADHPDQNSATFFSVGGAKCGCSADNNSNNNNNNNGGGGGGGGGQRRRRGPAVQGQGRRRRRNAEGDRGGRSRQGRRGRSRGLGGD